MNVKIDTREKFHVITIREPVFAANMTEKMDKVVSELPDGNVKNVIINMKDIQSLDNAAAGYLVKLQHFYYEQKASFVVCALQPGVKLMLDNLGILEQLNNTPTESEAADIVQMEEIEREFDNM